ncbi:MAG: S-layer homology domain-containing protein, partial [Acidimicrobiia bacterium]|nr:S-layer homology domain-containing protein [Acidimicrobiia bacterium]
MRNVRVLITASITFWLLVVALPAGAALPPGGTFVDDDGSIFEGSIEAIAAEGITRGCNPPTNDRYCPDDIVTRGQMAAFLVRALNPPPTSQDFFTDDNNSTFENDVNRLAAAGVTRGCNPPANDRFCPDDAVTRGQMAAFLHRGFDGLLIPGEPVEFIDDDGSTFEADIEWLGATGVTKGCNPPANDSYCPTRSVTRGEMAAFLTRALGLTPIVPPPRPSIALELVASGLNDPVYVTAPLGDDRVFIVEKEGTI